MAQNNLKSYFKPKNENSLSTNTKNIPPKPSKKTANPKETNNTKRNPHRIFHLNPENTKETEEGVNIETPTSLEENIEIITSPQEYGPNKESYHAIKDACWSLNQKVPFLALCKTFSLIEQTSSRLKMISILTNYFHSVIRLSPFDLIPSIYICLNQIYPAYEGKELGIGESTLISVLADSTGKKTDEIKKAISTYADLGIVAEKFKTSQNTMIKHKPLTVADVFSKFKDICDVIGPASNQIKKGKIIGLFTASIDCESRYLIRSLSKKLRIGLAEQSILVAVAHAYIFSQSNLTKTPPKEELDIAALTLKTSYCELPNYDILIPALLNHGLANLNEHCRMRVGIPVKPMLAVSSKSVAEILKRFDNMQICCEYKYDGERAQIHYNDSGTVAVFSRNQENSTTKFPDLLTLAPKISPDCKSFIIDAEVVAWDCVNSKLLPFQILTTRKRKNVNENEIKIRVCVFVFDLLFFNNEPMVCKTLRERQQILRQNFKEIPGEFMFATSKETNNVEEIQQILDESIKGNCEGLIIKTLDVLSTYEIAKRSHNWRKLKKDYVENLGDSLDLVVIGGFLGVGKRSGTYGGYLLACFDPDEEEYQTICKIGTGFSDEDLKEQFEYFSKILIPKPVSSYKYFDSLKPDHWFEPKIVWQIKAADLSLSPIHQAAINKIAPGKGISLRFPRYEKKRDDKLPEQASDIYQIIEMYKKQLETGEDIQNDSQALDSS